MVNTPLPSSLKSEAKKAAKILSEFSIPTSKTGPDAIIPTGLLVNAEGLAIITVAKVGFLITARGGSGIVIAKTRNGEWSAPSAIGIAGLGGGFEIGAEVTDFVIILNKRAAVDAFSKGGNVTVGGNLTVAAGPLGRNIEGDVSVRSPAAMYTYSKTKGLFAGISIEGSALIERKDANKKFYGEDIRAFDILGGEVDRPESCWELYDILDQHKEVLGRMALAMAKREASRQAHKAMEGGGIMKRVRSMKLPGRNSSHSKRDGQHQSWSDDETDGRDSGSSRSSSFSNSKRASSFKKPSHRKSHESLVSKTKPPIHRTSHESLVSRSRQNSAPDRRSLPPPRPREPTQQEAKLSTMTKSASFDEDWNKVPMVKALWGFKGEMPCDLTFQEGDELEIITRTGNQDDWWEGRFQGKVGIFPANYVQVL